MKHKIKTDAFSLVEVVVAVGIFAMAIVGVIGLLGPTTKNISDTRDTDYASRVISAIQSQLQNESFTVVAAQLGQDYPFNASRNGEKIALGTSGVWGGTNNEKFFEFSLIRNTQLSNNTSNPDNSAGFLAFFISLRWPAYLPNGQEVPDEQKSVMIIPAAITR